ncbi:MAG: hypothetical protein Q7K57_36370 [Burkholderiaceae bacterium]|nr:hypothetical protein [Burkholderiaceae bacterium]
MRHWLAPLLALAAGTFPVVAWPAAWWDMGYGRWSGSLDQGFNQSSQSSQSATGESRSSSLRTTETLRVQGTGLYLLDPRLVRANLGLQLNRSQGRASSSVPGDSGSDSRNADDVIGYNFDASILERKPYPATLYANRTQSQSTLVFGGRTQGIMESRGLSLQLTEDSLLSEWVGPWSSADLRARQEHRQDTTTFFGRTYRNDDTRRTLDFTAQKGFTTADLGLRYQFIDQSNGLTPQASNRSHTGNLNYSLDFGPGLNRNFGSSLSFVTRQALMPNNSMTASGALHLNHYRNLSTDYTYGFSRDEAEGAISVQHSGAASLTHQLYENLATAVSVSGNRITVPTGELSSFGGQVNQNYRHRLPGNGSLNLNWSGNYRRDITAMRIGTISLLGEKHTAPAVFGPGNRFVLGNAFVMASSVQVWNVRTGVRVLATEGADYNKVVAGKQLFIEPIFLTGLPTDPILPNDPLEVSYMYEVDPSLEYETRNAGFGVAVSYGWIDGSFQHQQSEQNPLVGEGRFLSSKRDDSFRLNLRGIWRDIKTQASASHVRSTSTDLLGDSYANTTRLELRGSGQVSYLDIQGNASFDHYRATYMAYDSSHFTATAIWRSAYNWDMVFTGSASNMHFLMPERQSTARSARGSLNWNFDGWRNTAYAEIRSRNDGDGMDASDTVMQFGARTSRRWGRMSLSASGSWDRWERGGTRSNSQNLNVNLSRAF